MDLLTIKNICKDDTIEVTDHFLKRCDQRGIRYSEVIEAIHNSEIIEDYPDDYPYPSCLLLGYTKSNRPLHIVTGSDGERLWFITAYVPDPEQWDESIVEYAA